VSPIAHTAGSEAVYVGPIFETRDDVQVRVVEGDFSEPCEICLARPTAVYVEIRRPDLDASRQAGVFYPIEPIERRFFCLVHICAADMVYRSY
jgi:hypothetical protein